VALSGGIGRPGEAGQASLELIAGLPVLLLAGLVALQLLAAGYAVTLADGAVEAGAIAIAGGRQPQAAVEEALPGWAADRVDLERRGSRLTLRLQPPSPFAAVARALEVSSSAWVREPAETGS
jgi:hypothetical protein